MNRSSTSIGTALWIGLVLAVAAYLYRLDSRHIPNIGDEPQYIQIVRVTAAQGTSLPLRSEEGVKNTKPPLLFWQGMLSTHSGKHWTLWRLRFPIVLWTGLAACLVGVVAARLTQSRAKGILAALLYLGAWSTFQHGRPFLTNAPETALLFLPLALLLTTGQFTWSVTLLSGLSLGVAALYKSVLLVAPVTVALAVILARRHGWRAGTFLRGPGIRLAVTAGLGVALFALWLVVDPQPEMILQQFLVQENAGKLRPGGYVAGLVSGTYPLTRIWLGNFANLGFYAFPLAGLVWLGIRRRNAAPADGGLAAAESDLWIYIVTFLLVYSVPSQRQENYLLPTVPALSVLLALNWEQIPAALHRMSLGLATLCLGWLLWLMSALMGSIPGIHYSIAQYAVAGGLLALALYAWSSRDRTRNYLPAAVCAAFLALGIALSAFDNGFTPAPNGPGMEALRHRTISFPNRFKSHYERYRFLVPGADVAGYNGRVPGLGDTLVAQGKLTALAVDLGAPLPVGAVVYGELLDLRTRLSAKNIRDLVIHSRFDSLVYRLVILEKTSPVE